MLRIVLGLLLGLVVLWVAAPSGATPIFLEPFDEVNSTTPNTQNLGLCTRDSGVSTTACVTSTHIFEDKTVIHDATSGGSPSSKWALHVTVSAGQMAYRELPVTFLTNTIDGATAGCTGASAPYVCCKGAGTSDSQGVGCYTGFDKGGLAVVSAGFSIHVTTFPASGHRQVFNFVSATGDECGLAVDATQKLMLTYNNVPAPGGGLSPGKLLPDGCDDSAATQKGGTGCTPANCPGASCECPAGPPAIACLAGAGWEGAEVVQGPTGCEGWFSGRRFARITTATFPVRNIRLGAPLADSQAIEYRADDFVLDNSGRAHWGYVDRMLPGNTCSPGCTNQYLPCTSNADCGTCVGSAPRGCMGAVGVLTTPGNGSNTFNTDGNDQWDTNVAGNNQKKPFAVNAYGQGTCSNAVNRRCFRDDDCTSPGTCQFNTTKTFLYDGSNYVNKQSSHLPLFQDFGRWLFASDPGLLTVSGLESVLIGFSPSGAGDHVIQHLVVDNCTPTYDVIFHLPSPLGCGKTKQHDLDGFGNVPVRSHIGANDDRVLDRFDVSVVPNGDQPWDNSRLSTLVTRVGIDQNIATRITAWLVNVRVERPDVQPRITFPLSNTGTDVPFCSWVGIGNSTAGGVSSLTCQQSPGFEGVPCSQDTYCAWDSFRALPDGGCQTDAQCKTCTTRQQEAGAGAGYQCLSDADCPTTGGVCDSGGTNFCSSGNAGMPCCVGGLCDPGTLVGGLPSCVGGAFAGQTCNASCNFPSGTVCQTANTQCVKSCPGPQGHCPAAVTSWIDPLASAFGCNTIVKASQQGEPTDQMIQNRLDNLLKGADPSMKAVFGVGQCQCSANPDCPSGTCSTANDHAPGRGMKLCKGGTNVRSRCKDRSVCKTCGSPGQPDSADCGPGGFCAGDGVCLCVFDPPSGEGTLEGVNYTALAGLFPPGATAPDCRGPGGVLEVVAQSPTGGHEPCDNCTPTACASSNDCDGVGGAGAAACAGVDAAHPGNHCLVDTTGQLFGTTCTVNDPACSVDGDCPAPVPNEAGSAATPMVCRGGHASEFIDRGFCRCTTDAQCKQGFKCTGLDVSGPDTGFGWCRKIASLCTAGPNIGKTCRNVPTDCAGVGACSDNATVACGAGMTVSTATTPHTCKATCSCPASACPGPSCQWNDGEGSICDCCASPGFCFFGSCFGTCSGGTNAGAFCINNTPCTGGGTCNGGADLGQTCTAACNAHGSGLCAAGNSVTVGTSCCPSGTIVAGACSGGPKNGLPINTACETGINTGSSCNADSECPRHKLADANFGVTREYSSTCDIDNSQCTGFRAPAKCCTQNKLGHCHGTHKCTCSGRQANRRAAMTKTADCTAAGVPAVCCTGLHTGTCDTDGDCRDNYLDYLKPVSHTKDVEDYQTIRSHILATVETDGHPLDLGVTVPSPGAPEGGGTWYDTGQIIDAARHQLRLLDGHMVDADRALRGTLLRDVGILKGCFTDEVHFSPVCAALIGLDVVLPWLDAQDTCAIVTGYCADNEDTPCTVDADCLVLDPAPAGGTPTTYRAGRKGKCLHLYEPQDYCRNVDDTFTSVACDPDVTICPNGGTCEPRPCTCACFPGAAGDQQCRNRYGGGNNTTCDAGTHACVCAGGSCLGGAGSSCRAFGGGFACSSGVCKSGGTDACAALTGSGFGDVCHVAGTL